MKTFVKIFFFTAFIAFLSTSVKAQPEAPTNLTVTQGTWRNYTFAKLRWSSPQNSTHFLRFNIYKKEGAIADSGSFKKTYRNIMMNFWVDKYVRRGNTYSYFVTAANRYGESPHSDTVEVTIDSTKAHAFAYGPLTDKKTGAPITNGKITFMPIFGWGMTTTYTDSLGNYTTSLYPGNYILLARAPHYFHEYYKNSRFIFNADKIKFNSGDSLSLDMSLQQKNPLKSVLLTGTVDDSLGSPIKAVIYAYSVVFNSRHKMSYRAVTDSTGAYKLHVLQGDTLIVFARPFNHKYFPQFYNGKRSFLTADRIPVNSNVTNINFVLTQKPLYNNGITGSVDNTDTVGVPAIVMAFRLQPKTPHRKRRYSTMTDSLGNFSFSHLFPGKYILLTIPQADYQPTFFKYDGSYTINWKDADSVMVDSNGITTGINFVVQQFPTSGYASISGSVKDKSGNPVDGVLVFARDENNETASFGITDKTGKYTISNLSPGSYTVTPDKFEYSSDQTASVSVDYNTSFSSSTSFTIASDLVTAVNDKPVIAENFVLSQNYPNPFNPTTIIRFSIPFASKVNLSVYNILGEKVAVLTNGYKQAGNYEVTFNAGSLSSGVYFYRLTAGNFVSVKKLILMK